MNRDERVAKVLLNFNEQAKEFAIKRILEEQDTFWREQIDRKTAKKVFRAWWESREEVEAEWRALGFKKAILYIDSCCEHPDIEYEFFARDMDEAVDICERNGYKEFGRKVLMDNIALEKDEVKDG